jgi:hypothetical protein
MATVTYETCRHLLEQCIQDTLEAAQKDLPEPLPSKLCFELDAFGQSGKELSLDEAMPFLYVNGTFPRVVDISVRGIPDDCTLVWLRPSGHHYVSKLEETWNNPLEWDRSNLLA